MPGGQARVHPEAITEARAARRWYEARNVEAAEAFVAELDLALTRIEEAPRAWPPYLADTRRYLLRQFPFFVVFREESDRVEILAVAHARRAGSLPRAHNIPFSGVQPGKDRGEVGKAKDDGRLPVEDRITRVVVFGRDGRQAAALAQALTAEAFHNTSYFDGTFEALRAGLK